MTAPHADAARRAAARSEPPLPTRLIVQENAGSVQVLLHREGQTLPEPAGPSAQCLSVTFRQFRCDGALATPQVPNCHPRS